MGRPPVDGVQTQQKPAVRQAAPVTGGQGPMTPQRNQGVSRATLPLSEGIAALELPDQLSVESLEDLRDWIETMMRRAERVARRTQIQAGITPPPPGPTAAIQPREFRPASPIATPRSLAAEPPN